MPVLHYRERHERALPPILLHAPLAPGVPLSLLLADQRSRTVLVDPGYGSVLRRRNELMLQENKHLEQYTPRSSGMVVSLYEVLV